MSQSSALSKDHSRLDLGTLPEWDLTHLYSSLKDPKIATNLKECETNAQDFFKKYNEHIKSKVLKIASPSFTGNGMTVNNLKFAQKTILNAMNTNQVSRDNGERALSKIHSMITRKSKKNVSNNTARTYKALLNNGNITKNQYNRLMRGNTL